MNQTGPALGSMVEDTRLRLVGVVMGHVGPNYQLRPPGGGREWDADPRDLRSLTAEEALSAKVREVNRQSRQGSRQKGMLSPGW